MDIIEHIRSEYPKLNKVRRRIADLLLEYPERCAFYSLKDIAAGSGATQVTILSFCRDMGYANYMALREDLQSYLIANIEFRSRIKLAYGDDENDGKIYDRLYRSMQEMVTATYETNTADTIYRFAQKIAEAKHVFITGHNVTARPAASLAGELIIEGVDARLLDIQNKPGMLALLSAWPPEECLLIAFGISPCGKSTIAISNFCRELGIEVLAVTDKTTSQIARHAAVSLICSVQLLHLYNSLAPIYFMIDAVMAFLSTILDERQGGSANARAHDLKARFDSYFLE